MISVALKLGRKISELPVISVTLVATKRPCVWKIGSACSRRRGVEAPGVAEDLGVRGKIAVAQHRALRPACRAGGVKNSGEIVSRPLNVLKLGRFSPSRLHQAPFPVRPERLKAGHA